MDSYYVHKYLRIAGEYEVSFFFQISPLLKNELINVLSKTRAQNYRILLNKIHIYRTINDRDKIAMAYKRPFGFF